MNLSAAYLRWVSAQPTLTGCLTGLALGALQGLAIVTMVWMLDVDDGRARARAACDRTFAELMAATTEVDVLRWSTLLSQMNCRITDRLLELPP